MGRVKELLLEKDWVEEEQEKILNDKHREISMVYADLLQYNDIDNCSMMYIEMMNGKVHTIQSDDVIEIHALSIRYRYDDQKVVVLPLDKVASVMYVGIEK